METRTIKVQTRLEKKLVKELAALPWAHGNKSEAIRTILEMFCALPKEKQADFLSQAAEKKFAS
jgi:hypothetical protein